MKINLKFLILTLIFANTIFAQQSVSINGASIVEVGIPYNYPDFEYIPKKSPEINRNFLFL